MFAIITLAVTIAYSNHFDNGFHLDDFHTINDNIYIQNLKNIPLFFKDATTFSVLPPNQSYRPVVTTTLAIDYWLGHGLIPFYFHLSTFILFIIQGFLMFFLYLKIFNLSDANRSHYILSAFAVSWYLLHPVNTETINYVIARSDSLSTLFVVLAFVLYIYSPFCRKWHLYLIPIAIGALAKPTAVMFAPLLLIYVACFEKPIPLSDISIKRGPAALKSILITILPVFLFCGFLFIFLQWMEPASWSPNPLGVSRFRYLITQPYVLFYYVTRLFFPVNLTADTDWVPFDSIFDIHVFIGVAFVLFFVFIARITYDHSKYRPISFGIVWFILALLPTSSVIPLAEVLNHHRLFFPYVGLMMSVCWSIHLILMWAQKSLQAKAFFKPLVTLSAIIILSGSAYGTYKRNEVWKTEETFWHDVTLKSPKSPRGLMSYGVVLMSQGDYTGAAKYFDRGLNLLPDYADLHINIAILKDAMNQFVEAEKFFKNAVTYGSDRPAVYFFYGRFLRKHGRIPEAVQNLNKALELVPTYSFASSLLMDIYYEQLELEKLALLANKIVQIAPNNQEAVDYLSLIQGKSKLDIVFENARTNKTPENFIALSLLYYQVGQFENSIDAAEEALKLRPNYGEAYNNICAAYNSLKMWDKAIIACEEAVRLKPDFQLAINNLAWARSQKKKL